MRPSFFSLNSFISFLSSILACEAAFVRRHPCELNTQRWRNDDFHIESLNGKIDQTGGTTTLTFKLLGIYNASDYICDELLLAGGESNGQFRVAGRPVGHLDQIKKQCSPAPTFWRLPESYELATWELMYSFDSPHRLQTLATEVDFKLRHEPELGLGCVAARITPDIGLVASGVFTYLPASIFVLVGLASWLSRAAQARGRSASPRRWKCQNLFARILVDLADYIRYLQFIFLAASLTMQYPGFYQPIASQFAWSSLLYWMGPVNHGFIYPGISNGIYTVNGTQGLEYMAQTLGFPAMSDIMVNALINLCIVAFGFAAVMVIVWVIRCGTRPSSVLDMKLVAGQTKEISYGLIKVPLQFFTLPLLAYLSYQLILVGHLPGYRIGLVVLIIGVLIGANLFIARYGGSHCDAEAASPELTTNISYDLLHGISMIQGLAIGGLQLWGWAQLLLLGGCEVLIIAYWVIQRPTRILLCRNFWCATIRLVTIILSISFVCPSSESTRQWIGYVMLILHGAVIIFGFLFISLWQIGRIAYCRRTPSPLPHLHSYELSSYHSGSVQSDTKSPQEESLHDLPVRYRLDAPTSPESLPYTPDMSFYRPPRPRISRGALSNITNPPPESPTLSTSSNRDSMNTVEDASRLDELLQLPSRSDVDYSVRESDMYYGRANPPPLELATTSNEAKPGRTTFSLWTRRAVEKLKRTKRQEKGFVVIRPRPTQAET